MMMSLLALLVAVATAVSILPQVVRANNTPSSLVSPSDFPPGSHPLPELWVYYHLAWVYERAPEVWHGDEAGQAWTTARLALDQPIHEELERLLKEERLPYSVIHSGHTIEWFEQRPPRAELRHYGRFHPFSTEARVYCEGHHHEITAEETMSDLLAMLEPKKFYQKQQQQQSQQVLFKEVPVQQAFFHNGGSTLVDHLGREARRAAQTSRNAVPEYGLQLEE